MQRFSSLFLLFLVPMLAVSVGSIGCGDKKEDKKAEKKSDGDKGAGTPAPAGERTPLASGKAVLKGKITYDGDPPARADLAEAMKKHEDKDHCLKPDPKNDTKDSKWLVGPDKGVQNVVVWVRSPKDKFFQLTDEQKKRSDPVTIDQPFCVFEPRVVAVYPSYFDGKKQVPTGQKFKALNSADIGHSTRWSGNAAFNGGKNLAIQAKGEAPIDAKPSMDFKSGDDYVEIKCDKHAWMQACAWIFDHPYHAVTKPDGTFEITGLPTGAELDVVYWHELMDRNPKVKKMTLKDGDNDLSEKIK